MQQPIIDQLHLIVDKLIKESGIDDLDYQIKLQENKGKEHGDYASNIAMILAKSLGRNPKDLAENISKNFKLDDQILKIEVAGPGFINFFVSELTHSEILRTIDSEKDKAMNDVKNTLAELSIDIAEKIIKKDLSKDSSQKKYVEDLIKEINKTK